MLEFLRSGRLPPDMSGTCEMDSTDESRATAGLDSAALSREYPQCLRIDGALLLRLTCLLNLEKSFEQVFFISINIDLAVGFVCKIEIMVATAGTESAMVFRTTLV